MDILLIYLLIVNAASFLLMLSDKHRAKNNLWRIPERALFAAAILGGSFGCLLGMYAVRHKTKHISFTAGIPIILALQIIGMIFVFNKT